jgi:hypothetical protein
MGHGLGHHGLAVGFVAHIALDESAAQFFGHSLAFLGLHVGDHHLAAVGRQHASGAFTQARCAAGDDENLALNVHVSLLFQLTLRKRQLCTLGAGLCRCGGPGLTVFR